MKNILLLREVSEQDLPIVGTKGISLSKLFKHKFNTPPGFIVTTTVFDKLLESAEIKTNINHLLTKLSEDLSNTNEISSAIQKLILSSDFPEIVQEDITEAYESLGFDPMARDASSLLLTKEEFVAVRSSYTEEINQLAVGSVALLNVKGEKRVIQGIKECYCSLFGPKVLGIMKRSALNASNMAVIIQKMVDAEKSGVAYSYNINTGSNSEILIKACFGLGEAITSGSIYPDEYTLGKKELQINDVKVHEKRFRLVRDVETEETIKEDLKEKSNVRVLQDPELIEVARITKKIVAHFEQDQVVEWALRDNTLYILNTRAIAKQKEHIDQKEESGERVQLEIYESEEEKVPDIIDLDTRSEIEDIEERNLPEPEVAEVDEGIILTNQDDEIATVSEQEEEIEKAETEDMVSDSIEIEATDQPPGEQDSEEIIEKVPQEEEEEEQKEEGIPVPEEESIFSSFKPFEEPQTELSKPIISHSDSPSLLSKAFFNAGNVIICCDMVIMNKLKEIFHQEFGRITHSYSELIDGLSDRRSIPYIHEIQKIHELKTKFLEELIDPRPEDVALALNIAEKFIEEI
ncbi:PEP/pyruvate-binding domain-containing protein [Candidatus Woesearchaeota archaeon]|nr:PEP/pyruvate-binding domain-containing protein [Candidatus Woesearchaeota archaeon]